MVVVESDDVPGRIVGRKVAARAITHFETLQVTQLAHRVTLLATLPEAPVDRTQVSQQLNTTLQQLIGVDADIVLAPSFPDDPPNSFRIGWFIAPFALVDKRLLSFFLFF